MGKAIKQSVYNVGWVVFWKEDRKVRPLRNFGDWQYAAIEFAAWLNKPHNNWERISRSIERWAETFNPANKYKAPEINGDMVTLRKQDPEDKKEKK